MNIFLTFDYEIFFGEVSGSVDKCMIEPTQALLDIATKESVFYTFFWDVGHYLALKRYETDFPNLREDRIKIENQLNKVLDLGHDIQLHIHPHWEKSVYEKSGWKMNLQKHYKLSDFDEVERTSIFNRYNAALSEFKGKKSIAFRAGGWCVQPFSDLKPLFLENQILYDSSTMPGVKWISENYQLDFTELKSSEPFRFSDNECEEDRKGDFIEYPIATHLYSAWFFWRLYMLGRLFPSWHKMWGDGNFIAQPGGKKESLLRGKIHHASADGYFASKLQAILNQKKYDSQETLVIIGHPKSMTKYSIMKLAQFIQKHSAANQFTTFQNLP